MPTFLERVLINYKKWVPISILVSIAGVWLLACAGGDIQPECPHTWDFSQILITVGKHETARLKTRGGTGLLSGPGMNTNIPEFHDCQRLVHGAGTDARYDSLTAVFAWDSMNDTSLIGGLQELPGRFNQDTVAVPMVEIVSWGGYYPSLAIEPGFNCIFIWAPQDRWGAVIIHGGDKEPDCHTPRPLTELRAMLAAGARELSITRTSETDLGWDDYPPVARWDWDAGTATQVIGFKCLTGWCEVRERGASVTSTPNLATSLSWNTSLVGTRVLRVKGWYDQQRLTPSDARWSVTGKAPSPQSVIGTLIPAPNLGELNADADFKAKWRLMSYLELSKASEEYDKKYHFQPSDGQRRMTTISLCLEIWPNGVRPGATGECRGLTAAVRSAAKCTPEKPTSSPDEHHWWARTIATDGSNRDWCIVRRDHSMSEIPGTVRWRWLADDETAWGRCKAGCCTGQ